MPTKVLTTKHPNGTLIPASDDDKSLLTAYAVGDTFKITTSLWVRKEEGGTLVAESASDQAFIDNLGDGELVEIEIEKKRNLKHHRLFMVLMRAVFDNQDRYTNFEAFLNEVKILTGFVTTHISSTGSVYYIVKSISFEKMDEAAFRKWKNEALQAVFDHFFPTMEEADRMRLEHLILTAA